MDIRNIKSIDDLIIYFTEELNWNIDLTKEMIQEIGHIKPQRQMC